MPRPSNAEFRRDLDLLLKQLSSEVGRLLDENNELRKLQGVFDQEAEKQWPVIGMQLKELPAQQSAWRNADAETAQCVYNQYKNDSNTMSRSTSKMSNSGTADPVLELFQSLDEANCGSVSFAEISRFLRRQGESFDYLDLINVLRVHNGLEAIPHSVQDHSEAASSERLSIDFGTFAALATPPPPKEFGGGVEVVVKTFQRAVQKELAQPKSALGRALTRSTSRISHHTSAALHETFLCIDEAGAGQLFYQDLARLFQKHGEAYDYLDLINVLRTFNQLEPIPHSVQDHSEAECSEKLYLNIRSFMNAMVAKPDTACLKSLQSICQREADARLGGEAPKKAARMSVPQQAVAVVKLATTSAPKGNIFWLEMVPTMVILVNMVVTGLAIDFPEHRRVWDVLEVAFVIFYTLEAIGKFQYFGCGGFFCGRGRWWNWFDFICLIVSYFDTFVELLLRVLSDGSAADDSGTLEGLRLAKVIRLTRLVRLVRTLRFKIFHELKLMVMGIFAGFRCLSWACVLLLFLAYPMGVGLTSMLAQNWPEFDTVPNSMFTLFRCWTEGCSSIDGAPLAERLYRRHGFPFMALHILMTMFVTVGLFNLIMAIFIDNVVNTQAHRKAKEMAERKSELELKFKELFTVYINEGIVPKPKTSLAVRMSKALAAATDTECGRTSTCESVASDWEDLKRSTNTKIDRELFNYWLEQEEFQQLLDDADIETQHGDLFDVLDSDLGGQLSMEELISGLMRLRGPVSKADIVAVRLKVRYLTAVTERMESSQAARRASTATNVSSSS